MLMIDHWFLLASMGIILYWTPSFPLFSFEGTHTEYFIGHNSVIGFYVPCHEGTHTIVCCTGILVY
jgi:hypothetical protein